MCKSGPCKPGERSIWSVISCGFGRKSKGPIPLVTPLPQPGYILSSSTACGSNAERYKEDCAGGVQECWVTHQTQRDDRHERGSWALYQTQLQGSYSTMEDHFVLLAKTERADGIITSRTRRSHVCSLLVLS